MIAATFIEKERVRTVVSTIAKTVLEVLLGLNSNTHHVSSEWNASLVDYSSTSSAISSVQVTDSVAPGAAWVSIFRVHSVFPGRD